MPRKKKCRRRCGLGAALGVEFDTAAEQRMRERAPKFRKEMMGRSCVVVGKLPRGVSVAICEGGSTGVVQAFAFQSLGNKRRRVVGEMTATQSTPLPGSDAPRFRVGQVEVDPDYRSLKIGTRLYEHMLQYACRKGGILASDTLRSPFAEAFWRKQAAKGRAVCGRPDHFQGDVYMTPLFELREKLPPDEFMSIIERLPAPLHEGTRNYWPCQEYHVSCSTTSLDGLRRAWGGLDGRVLRFPAERARRSSPSSSKIQTLAPLVRLHPRRLYTPPAVDRSVKLKPFLHSVRPPPK